MTLSFNVPPYVSAVLQIDLNAIAQNYRQLKRLVNSSCHVAAMLKSNAYGLGATAIGARLYKEGCRHFFFAYVEEAIKEYSLLSKEDTNLIVLNGVFKDSESYFQKYNLIPVLINLDQINRWYDYNKKNNSYLKCIIHVDTGMGREGLSRAEFKYLITHKDKYFQYLNIIYIISHLGNSNNIHDPKNMLQYERFINYHQQLPGVKASLLSSEIKSSLVNSSGIALGPAFHFDLVRPGLALYGYKSAWGEYSPLTPSVSAYGRILLTRTVDSGESIGYQGTYVCEKPTKIALISVGHSDGILRCASNVGYVKINQLRAPIIGRISMDMMMVDITDHPDNTVHSGNWATLYDDAESMHDFAENEQTSIYEVLVKHGHRFHRIYKD